MCSVIYWHCVLCIFKILFSFKGALRFLIIYAHAFRSLCERSINSEPRHQPDHHCRQFAHVLHLPSRYAFLQISYIEHTCGEALVSIVVDHLSKHHVPIHVWNTSSVIVVRCSPFPLTHPTYRERHRLQLILRRPKRCRALADCRLPGVHQGL